MSLYVSVACKALMPHSTRVPVKGFQCERYPGYLLPNTGTHPARTMAESKRILSWCPFPLPSITCPSCKVGLTHICLVCERCVAVGGPGVCAGWVLSCRGDVGDVSTAFVFIRKDHRPEPDPMRRVDITGEREHRGSAIWCCRAGRRYMTRVCLHHRLYVHVPTGCCNLYVYQSVMVAYLCARRFYKSRMGPTTRFTVSITSDLGLNGSSLGLPVFGTPVLISCGPREFAMPSDGHGLTLLLCTLPPAMLCPPALLIEALKGLRLDPGTYLTGEVGLDGKCATRVSGLAAKLHAVTPFFVATVKMNPRIKGCKPLVIGVPTDNVRGKVLVEDDPSFLQHGGSRDYKVTL